MKNQFYKPLQKLVIIVMLLFAGNAVAQTATGTKAETKTYSPSVVSTKPVAGSQKATTAKQGSTFKATAAPTTKTNPRVSGGVPAVKPQTKATAAKPVKTGAAYNKAAPMNREAQLKAYIADIDAKMPKAKGTANEAKLLSKKATFQKELNEINAKKANLKKN